MRSKTFLLCMGAPKCGTTWLYHYLRSFDEVTFGFKKELHVFDTVYLPHCRYFINRAPSTREAGQQPFVRKYHEEQDLLASFRENHALYFDYFRALMVDRSKCVTADITPTYLALPASTLALIRDGFSKRGIDVKVVLLLRDPIDRIISSCRMALRLGMFAGTRIAKDTVFEHFLDHYSRASHVCENTRYDLAIDNIKMIFPSERVHVGFLETMFSRDEIRRLSDFIGVPVRHELASTAHNRSMSTGEAVDGALLADLRERFDEQYEACNAEFPDVGIAHIWKHFSRP